MQRLNLNVSSGESGPILRFWLHEFPQHPVDLPIRSLVDFAVETIQEPTVDYLCRLYAWQFLRGVCISALGLHIPSMTSSGFSSYKFADSLPAYPLNRLCDIIRKLDSNQTLFSTDKPSEFDVHNNIFLSPKRF